MHHQPYRIVVVAGLLTAFCGLSGMRPVDADTVEISGGGHLTGDVSRQADSVVIRVDDEIHIALPASRVRRVVDSDQLAAYRAQAAKAGDDAELHYQLAVWCVTASNVPGNATHYRNHHLQRAISLDPDHARARAGLGYKKENGQWIKTSDLMRGRGMISRAGRWELPEAVAIDDFQQNTDVNAKKWIKEVKRLVALVLRDTKKSPEALAALKAIEDPLASSAIADQLNESRGRGNHPRELRMLWIRLLGKFRDVVSVRTLVQAGLMESDEVIREAALDLLKEYGYGSAVATYLPLLRNNENKLVTNEFELDGNKVDLANLSMPVLNIYAKHDHIVPPCTSRALKDYLDADLDYEELELNAGHIGAFVSGKANQMFSDKIADWVSET